MKSNYILSLLLSAFHFSSFSQLAEDFMLDSSFGKNGRIVTVLNKNLYSTSTINSVLVQENEKIVVAGFISNPNYTNTDILLARYLPNGKIDLSFADSGLAINDLGSAFDFIADAKLLSDGKIITAAGTNKNYYLIRFLKTGFIDTNFGIDGKVSLPEAAYSMVVDKQDNIYLAGESIEKKALKFTVRHYNKKGILDSSFGSQGLASVKIGRQQLNENPKISLDSNHNIIVGGTSAVGVGSDNFIIIRFKRNGIIDSSFNKIGWCYADYNNEQNSLGAISIQPDNKIVCGGSSETSNNFTLTRINTDGKIDSSFGKDGFVLTDFSYNQNYNPYDYITALAIQDDNKIVAAGTSLNNNLEGQFALSRYNNNGILDQSFGLGGKLKTTFRNGKSRANAMALQPDGKIVVAGNFSSDINTNGVNGDIAIARYNKEKSEPDYIPFAKSKGTPIYKSIFTEE